MSKTFLNEFQQAFEKSLKDQWTKGASEEQLLEGMGAAFERSRAQIGPTILKDLKRRTKSMLKAERAKIAGFEKRNFDRWKPAFDIFEAILEIVHEVGAQHDADFRPQAIRNQDWRFEAVSHIHARGLLVAREIYGLLRCGFPDGALARWRTLHELTTTAIFISQCEPEIAFRYLASFRFAALRAARQLSEFAERADMEPFSAEEIRLMEEECVALTRHIGERLKSDYDWATPSLGNGKATFDRIEKSVGLDHWRPRYRWASQHNHGGHRPGMNLLGACESEEPLFLVGPSNSGFVDPLHMSSVSLMQLFSTFLLNEPNLDRIIIVDVVNSLVDELGPLAIEVERTSLEARRARSH
ncbi:MAG TPA: DUF5677 domain-containing protein [Allosphingosinicella sp.]|nr:DUF5677 domain-containing protein [Allosphingosinicella sp.]